MISEVMAVHSSSMVLFSCKCSRSLHSHRSSVVRCSLELLMTVDLDIGMSGRAHFSMYRWDVTVDGDSGFQAVCCLAYLLVRELCSCVAARIEYFD